MCSRAAPPHANGTARRVRLIATMVLLACLIIPAVYAAWPYAAGYSSMTSVARCKTHAPATPEPSKSLVQTQEQTQEAIMFPSIDWDTLKSQNPAVIAWITVPGTAIDYPVVQASASNPQFYLTHDINGNRSLYGCPYLDADVAAQGGTHARFPVIYGHHLINGLMFSNFARYSETAYALEHRQILLMTPEENFTLEVIGANVVDADVEGLQVAFESDEELAVYLRAQLANSEVVLPHSEDQLHGRVFCFVTCSYGSDNERTLVYAAAKSTI